MKPARRLPRRVTRQSRLPEATLPPRVADLARGARKIVEVGAGRDFRVALALKGLAPGAEVLVTDVSPGVLDAPRDLAAFCDDVTRPAWALYEGADLVVGVRTPEELQLAVARVARKVGAALALRPLKDEWADVSEAFPRFEVVGDGWRIYRP